MRFQNYAAFKDFVWNAYQPFPQEMSPESEGFAAGSNWARREAPRFFRALRTLDGHIEDGSTLLDVGVYPGSFVQLVRHSFGANLGVTGCGMPVAADFEAAMKRKGIAFRACDVDPDVVQPTPLPVGLPFETGSLNVITCMEVVEHLYSLKTLFTECRRVLAPGGILYVTTDNIGNRDGLVRVIKTGHTNLDSDLGVTTIWSDSSAPHRRHVRYLSLQQVLEAGAMASLKPVSSGFFEHYEDPDVFVWPDRGALEPLRKLLRGHGERPPVRLGSLAEGLYYIGPRALANHFRSKLEVVFTTAD